VRPLLTESPCTGVCRLDPRRVCEGCGRLLDEIIEWPAAGESRKREIVAAARQRIPIIPPNPTRAGP